MKKYIYITLLFLCGAFTLFAQNDNTLFPTKPEPAVYVHDYSNMLTSLQRNELEQELRAMNDTTSSQIVVMIRPDIGDYDRASYAIELGNKWGVGQGKKDNGVIMLIVTEGSQRGVFISTGYGVEGALTDVSSSRISREMVNYFRNQQFYEGIQYGVTSIVSAIHGEYSADTISSSDSEDIFWPIFLLFLIIVGIILIAIFGKFETQTYSGTGSFGNRRNNTGGGGWGGGSSWGGGGSSGGGWGGGSFGGGSFGGGGGGASW